MASRTEQEEHLSIFRLIEHRSKTSSDVAIMNLLRNELENADKSELKDLLYYAIESSIFTLEMIELIIEAGANPRSNKDRPFMLSCGRDDDDFSIPAYFLNECDVDLNSSNGSNATCGEKAFCIACGSNNYNIAQKLLDNGVVLNTKVVKYISLRCEDDNKDKLLQLFVKNGVEPENVVYNMLVSTVEFYDEDKNFLQIYKQARKIQSSQK